MKKLLLSLGSIAIFGIGITTSRTYENDEGEKKYVFEIISNDLLLLNK